MHALAHDSLPRNRAATIRGLRQLAASCTQLLTARHRTADLGNKQDALQELVYISLTRQTHPQNALRSWHAIARAGGLSAISRRSQGDVERLIRPSGLSRQKAKWILGALRQIRADFGALSLRAAQSWPDARLERYLRSLPGIGIKTAKCVMMYSLGRRVLPVDVHVRRVATRLGLVPPGLSEVRIHQELENVVAPRLRYAFHVNAVWHGRKICSALRPRCDDCCLAPGCAFKARNIR